MEFWDAVCAVRSRASSVRAVVDRVWDWETARRRRVGGISRFGVWGVRLRDWELRRFNRAG
jgi:hypothetical protein